MENQPIENQEYFIVYMDDNLNRIEEMLPYKGAVGSKEVFNREPISLDTSKKKETFNEVQRPGDWFMSDEDSNINGSSSETEGNFNNGTSNEGNVNNVNNEGRSVSGKNYNMDPNDPRLQEGGKKSRKQKKRKSRKSRKQKQKKQKKTRKNV